LISVLEKQSKDLESDSNQTSVELILEEEEYFFIGIKSEIETERKDFDKEVKEIAQEYLQQLLNGAKEIDSIAHLIRPEELKGME